MTSEPEPSLGPAPQPVLTVAAVARRLGVAPSTLRTWDRRYGLGPSAHTAGSHRRYGPGDLHRLSVMRGLTLEGVPPAEAAQIALGPPPAPAPTGASTSTAGPASTAPPAPPLRPRPAPPEQGRGSAVWITAEPLLGAPRAGPPPEALAAVRAGGGRVLSLPDASPRLRGMARAAMALDTLELTRLLRDAIAGHGVVEAWQAMIAPILQGLGERWRVTGEAVDVEHAFSEAVLGALREVAGAPFRPRNVVPVVLACAGGDQHSLPLHVLAAALAQEEIGCRMLGAGLPSAALVAAVRRTGPAVVFVYARMPVTDAAVLRDLPRQRPAPRVLAGGPGWGDVAVPAPATRVESLAEAVVAVLGASRR
jgi:MerR family transcriptional regulator, light-induced transcriptional regulator